MGHAFLLFIICAALAVKTLVFPEPAPAKYDIRPTIEKIDPYEVTESRLQEMVPPAKPSSKNEQLDDIEVVYRPIIASIPTAKPTTTVETTTTTMTTTTTAMTTTTTPITTIE